MSPQDFARITTPEEVRRALARWYPSGTEFEIVLNAKGTAYDVTVNVPVKVITVTTMIPEEGEKE